MKLATAVVLLTLTHVPSIRAQENQRFYLGGGLGVETGSRSGIDVGAVGALGLVAGVRLGRGWSLEGQVDQGFGEGTPRVFEGFLFSRRHSSTEEERRRVGVFGRSVYSESAGTGYAVQFVWTTRSPDRVNAAFTAGVNWRSFSRHHARTITEVGPDAGIPPGDPELQDIDRTDRLIGGGYSVGVLVPVRVTAGLRIEPEAKFTFGGVSRSDGFYKVFRMGLRVLWGF